MGEVIKAIETEYKGFIFRSRLEARWAVFWDALNVRWRYEHEGYETKMGRYLPDFWLPSVFLRGEHVRGIYQEVKPESYISTSHDKLEALCESKNGEGIGGVLTRGFEYSGLQQWGHWDGVEGIIEIAPTWDMPMYIHVCKCGAVKFEFPESSYYQCPKDKCNMEGDDVAVQDAYDEAIRYRFW
jgi:hypothetical protein